MYFCPILRVAVFSYPVGGQVFPNPRLPGLLSSSEYRKRTNVQQLTCNIDLSNSFYYLFFSLVLIELKPFLLKAKVLGENFGKSVKKVRKFVKNYETILPFSCCPLVFPWFCGDFLAFFLLRLSLLFLGAFFLSFSRILVHRKEKNLCFFGGFLPCFFFYSKRQGLEGQEMTTELQTVKFAHLPDFAL